MNCRRDRQTSRGAGAGVGYPTTTSRSDISERKSINASRERNSAGAARPLARPRSRNLDNSQNPARVDSTG